MLTLVSQLSNKIQPFCPSPITSPCFTVQDLFSEYYITLSYVICKMLNVLSIFFK